MFGIRGLDTCINATIRSGLKRLGKNVIVKTKTCIWKAMVVDPEPSTATNSASQSSRKNSISGWCTKSKKSLTGSRCVYILGIPYSF